MAWVLRPEAVGVLDDAPVGELLNVQSLPVRLPLSQNSEPMPLFSSLAVETVACEAVTSHEPNAPTETHDFAVDSVLYAGAPVWALDWCPFATAEDATAGPLQTVETLALTTHPKGQRRNPIGLQHTGPGAVQLWAVPSSVGNSLVPSGLPKLLALLWHEGKLAWDVQWCPDPSAFISPISSTVGATSGNGADVTHAHVPVQGLLAVVLGNGDVVIWAAPTVKFLLDMAPANTQQQQQQAEDMQQDDEQQASQQQQQQQLAVGLSLQLQPIMQLLGLAVGGSLASCCSWLPAAPHDQMLVGHWDGNVSIWKLPTTAGSQPEPIQLLRADPTPIRSLAWQPTQRWWCTGRTTVAQAAAMLDSTSRLNSSTISSSSTNSNSIHYFLTGSSIGNLKVWDTQDVLQPCHERIVSRNTINSCLWMGPPHVWITASSDGVLRQIWLDAGVQATSIATWTADVSGSCGSVWSLSGCAPMAVVAYVADGGLLGLMPLEPPTGENRHRKSHAALSAVAVAEDQLWLLSAREIPGNGGLYTNIPSWKDGGYKKKTEPASTTVVVDPLPHPDQVLHTVKFSPNYRGLSMLAYGGGAGVVRVHSVSADVIPVGM